jgi:hypothetical protein
MSQGSLFVPTTGTVSGLAFAQATNTALDALATCNSGAAAPTNAGGGVPEKGQLWVDTSVTPNALRQFDGNSNWVTLGYIDATNHIFATPIGGGSTTVASASTVDLGAQSTASVTISGIVTITSFGSSAVPFTIHPITFSGNLTLTYNATSLILPGAANIVTQANDVALAAYLGGGNWQVIAYTPATIPTKASPTTSDFVLIQDAAANNTPKKSLVSAIAAISQVTGIDSKTGAFTTGNGIDSTGGNVIELTAARRTLPTKQVFTSGSGTYTTPANCLWIRVRMVGGGGGGGGGNNSSAATGAGVSTFSGATLLAGPGSGASAISGPSLGGSASGGNVANIPGGSGGGSSGVTNAAGGMGGSSFFGGGGGGGAGGVSGLSGAANSGGGGGGGGGGVTTSIAGGGGAGGYVEHIIQSPASTYTYAVGAGGAGMTGISAGSGGAGAGGIIIVEEFYN